MVSAGKEPFLVLYDCLPRESVCFPFVVLPKYKLSDFFFCCCRYARVCEVDDIGKTIFIASYAQYGFLHSESFKKLGGHHAFRPAYFRLIGKNEADGGSVENVYCLPVAHKPAYLQQTAYSIAVGKGFQRGVYFRFSVKAKLQFFRQAVCIFQQPQCLKEQMRTAERQIIYPASVGDDKRAGRYIFRCEVVFIEAVVYEPYVFVVC